MDLTKYKWKCRILLLSTSCYRDSDFKSSKEFYQKYIKEFHNLNRIFLEMLESFLFKN